MRLSDASAPKVRAGVGGLVLNSLSLTVSVVAILTTVHNYLDELIRLSYFLGWIIAVYKHWRNWLFHFVPFHVPNVVRDCLIASGFLFAALNCHTLWNNNGTFFNAVSRRIRLDLPRTIRNRMNWIDWISFSRTSSLAVLYEARTTLAWCVGLVLTVLVADQLLVIALPHAALLQTDPCFQAYRDADPKLLLNCRGN